MLDYFRVSSSSFEGRKRGGGGICLGRNIAPKPSTATCVIEDKNHVVDQVWGNRKSEKMDVPDTSGRAVLLFGGDRSGCVRQGVAGAMKHFNRADGAGARGVGVVCFGDLDDVADGAHFGVVVVLVAGIVVDGSCGEIVDDRAALFRSQ